MSQTRGHSLTHATRSTAFLAQTPSTSQVMLKVSGISASHLPIQIGIEGQLKNDCSPDQYSVDGKVSFVSEEEARKT